MPYNDEDAFRRAIRAAPGDTTVKLVYADWLQDRGDARAEFVRLQVELHAARTPAAAVEAAAWVVRAGPDVDPDWVAFLRAAFAKA